MTSPERWREIQRVLDGALDRSSETRSAFITESCGDDVDLSDQVRRLVQACERAEQRESVLASPASELALPMLADLAAVGEGRRAALMDALQEALSSRYAVERVIQKGGMSTVFLAYDLRHDRAVAVKVLARDVVAPAGVKQFLKEIRVTARLNHPHVLPVHDSGEVEGLLYFVTPYVEGETLRARLNSGDHLSLPDILRLLRELADALAFAHARGIVHRDLKPENILLSGGHAVVGDFGIAKALTDAAETGAMPGAPFLVLGTPAYMAPEQADGTIPTDHRCDLYAFGLVAYELLAGVHPFHGRSGRALLRAQRDEMPRPLDAIRPDLPSSLVSLVMRCLAKSPAARPDDAGAVLSLLDESLRQLDAPRRPWSRRAVIAGLAAAGMLAVSAATWLVVRPERSLISRGVLAVREPIVMADFQAAGTDSGLGLTLGRMFGRYLGESRVFTVMPQSHIDSVLRLMRRTPGPLLDLALAREVAERAGARAVVTGELARLDRGYLVTVRLVSAATGEELAYFHDNAASNDAVLRVLERIGGRLRRRIGESLKEVSAGPPLRALTTGSLAALRSLSAGAASRESDGERRIALVREAIALDSMFAYAYLVLANFSQAPQSADMRDSALTRAYLMRDQLTQSERTTVTAFYWQLPGRDRRRTIEAYEAQIARGFGDRISVLNVGAALNDVRQFARTDSLMRRFEAQFDWLVHRNLALAQIGQGRVAAADSTIARVEARARRTDIFWLQSRVKVFLATLRFDSAALFAGRIRAIADANSTDPPLGLLIPLARVRGRVGESQMLWSEAAARSVVAGLPSRALAERVASASDELWLRGRPADARRRLDSLFRTRPIASLGRLDERIDGLRAAALYAASGRPERARWMLAGIMAAADSLARRALYSHQQVVLGEIAIAEGRPLDAMAAFRRSDFAADGLPVSACVVCVLPALARAAERAGWADSSRALWERYVTTPSDMRLESDSWFLAMAYRELRRLHAQAGNRDESAAFDRRLAGLWWDADPEFRKGQQASLVIGPEASPYSTRQFSRSDSVLVADFVVRGADSSLGSTIASLVRTDLTQSNVVTVVSDGTIRAALERMRHPAGAPLVSDIARELAQREGFPAVIEGEFQALGSGYLITVRLVSAEGDPLALSAGTASLKELLPTIGQLTRRLRGRIGESLEHVRSSPPLPQVTSHSIAALRKYDEGTRALRANDYDQSVQLLTEAVTLDSTFAMAWVVLGAAYRDGNFPQDRWEHAVARAFHHRERLPARERYHAEGMFFRTGPARDRVRAARAYEKGLLLDTASFANNLGLLYQSRREYARAESLFRWYVDRGRNLQVAYDNLANALYFQGRRAEAESIAAVTASRFPNSERRLQTSWYVYNRGQLDSAQFLVERLRTDEDATMRRFAWLQLSSLHLVRGRVAEAVEARSQAEAANTERGISRDLVADRLTLASHDIWYRDQPARGLGELERVLIGNSLGSLPLVSSVHFEPYYLWVARIFAQGRRPDRAREMLAQFLADRRDTLLHRFSVPAIHSVRGEIALAEGRPRDALQEFRRADQLPDGPIHLHALGLYADVGRAFDTAGLVDSAIAAYEQYLEMPQLNRLSHDAVYLAQILQRLGALYEAKGDRVKAIGYYERFVQLWQKADPELLPRVATVRKRIESLRSSERP